MIKFNASIREILFRAADFGDEIIRGDLHDAQGTPSFGDNKLRSRCHDGQWIDIVIVTT